MSPTWRNASGLVPVLAIFAAWSCTKRGAPPAEPVAAPAPAPASVQQAPPGCDELGPVLLSVEPERLLLACENRHHECSGRATLTVRSCAVEAIEFREVVLRPAPPLSSPVVSTDQLVRLEPGDTWTIELELEHRGTYELTIPPFVSSGKEPRPTVGTATLSVENPARDQAIADCRACNGEWGNHGIFGTEGCVCRTSDGGTPCDDGADCEGDCVEQERGSGFRCAEFTTMFGCRSYLPDGWSKRRPQRRGEEVVPPYMCID